MVCVVLDIETVPTQDPALIELVRGEHLAAHEKAIAAVRAPSNYKDSEKIANYVVDQMAKLTAEYEAKAESAYLATSLDGLGHVCAIGWAVDTAPVRVEIADDPEREAALLRLFFDVLADAGDRARDPTLLVGHNLIGFDLPFLWKRAIVLGVEPPRALPRDPKPWLDGRTFDTMLEWSGKRGFVSLQKLARVLGVDSGVEHSGDQIWALVQAGRFDEVRAKCASDVETTRTIYRRMTFAPELRRAVGV